MRPPPRQLRPLPRAVLALASGILASLRFTLPGIILFLALAACVALLITPAHRLARSRRRYLAPLFCILGGVILGHRAADRALSDCRVQIPDNTTIVAIGTITVAPPPGAGGLGTILLDEVRVGKGARSPCAGEVRFRARRGRARTGRGEEGALAVGAPVLLRGRWQAFPPDGAGPRPPERAGMILVDSVSAAPDRARATGSVAVYLSLQTLRASAQERFRTLLPRQSAFAEALLLARKEGIDPEDRDRFVRAGLAHLLAISGLHVGLIAGALLLLGGILRLPPVIIAAGTIALTIAYVIFLGAPHAAARAALQVTLALTGRLLQRPADPFSLIAAAAVFLLVLDPLALLDPGFQLSFAGTAGIIAIRRPLLDSLPTRLPGAIRESVAVSLAATIVTSPITVLHFGQIAPIGVIANLAAIPVTGVAVPALALSILASFISTGLGAFLAGAAELLLDALHWIAATAASVPGGQLLVPRDAVFGWALAAAGASVMTGWLAGRRRDVRPALRRATATAVAAALLIVWPLAVTRFHDGRLEVHAIDVGQGDALAIRTPGGSWILVDAGPGGAGGYDAGRARVVPFLLRQGARRVDALILTHPDSDHIGGAAAVLESFDVGLVIDPGVALGRPLYRELLSRADRGEIRWIRARADLEITIDDVSIHLLHPDDELDETPSSNHLSVAFRLGYGRFGALFLGDAPADVEEKIAERYGAGLSAQLLKVAHHGSTTSTAEAILAAAEPTMAFISVGRNNRYGHPAPEVLRRLEAHGIEVHRTDLSGTITLRVGPDAALDLRTQR